MITIKTDEEIRIMGESGRILAVVLDEVVKMAQPGITTLELDRSAEALILKNGGKPAFKGYSDFPFSLCASVNETVVHGLPSEYALREGDILGLDLGVVYKGYNSDMAVTIPIGKIRPEVEKLLDVAKKSLSIGIREVKDGATVGDIGNAVQKYIESNGFGVIRDLCGHGIGKELHEDPKIPNYGKARQGEKLVEGMVICIEPMVTAGDYQIKKAPDGYGFATRDNSLTAHFEHTIAITKKGAKILTQI